MPERAGRSQREFSLEVEKSKLYFFFAFPKPKRGDWRGYTQTKTENNWSSFHLLEKEYWILILWEIPRSRKDQRNWKLWSKHIQFSSFQVFFKVYQNFKEGLVELLLWEIQRSFPFKIRIILHNNKTKIKIKMINLAESHFNFRQKSEQHSKMFGCIFRNGKR